MEPRWLSMLNRCTSLILLLSVSLAEAQPSAAGVILQPLEKTPVGAGCTISIGDHSGVVMTVEFRSIESSNASADVARVRIADVVYPLDWVDRTQKHWIFRAPDLTIKLEGMTEIEPICHGSECEGSHYQATLSMDHKGEHARFKALAHCGA